MPSYYITEVDRGRLNRVVQEVERSVLPGPQWQRVPPQIVHESPKMRRFRLDETLHINDLSVSAYIIEWDRDTETWIDRERIDLFNPFAMFEGDAGHRGYCFYFLDAGRWEIIQMECP